MLYNNRAMIDRIKQIKNEKGLTNESLAIKSGVALSTLSKILSGNTKEPSISAIIKIADALNTSADYIFFGKTIDAKSKYDDLNKSEQTHIQKYRKLDDYGKDMVDTVLDKELTRMESQSTPQYIESKVAARGGGVMKHIMTKEELEKADAETTEFEGFDELQKFDLDD